MRRAPTISHTVQHKPQCALKPPSSKPSVPRKPPQCILKPPASNPSAGNNHPKMPRIGCPTGEVGVTDIRSAAKRLRDSNMMNLKGITPKSCYSTNNNNINKANYDCKTSNNNDPSEQTIVLKKSEYDNLKTDQVISNTLLITINAAVIAFIIVDFCI